MEMLRRFSSAFYQKMVIPREKEFSPSAFGVYPRPRELPSPVCCFQIMHIRTGAMWIAYGEMMWITSQVSFWAAQAVTGGWNPMTILLGFLTVILQIILVIHLVKGIREFRLSLLLVYMCGVVIRIAIFLTSFFSLTFMYLFAGDEPSIAPYIRFAYITMAFLLVSTFLKIYAFLVIRRCHEYIERTKSFFRTPQEVSCSHSLSFGKCEKDCLEKVSLPREALPPLPPSSTSIRFPLTTRPPLISSHSLPSTTSSIPRSPLNGRLVDRLCSAQLPVDFHPEI